MPVDTRSTQYSTPDVPSDTEMEECHAPRALLAPTTPAQPNS